MHVVYHIGVHCTDEDRLIRCLLKNKGRLAAEGIMVPGPSRYRPMLRETVLSLQGAPASIETQEMLLDAVVDADQVERVVFSSDNFLCQAVRALSDGMLYPMAGERMRWMRLLFPSDPCECHVGIRNPATLLPALFQTLEGVSHEEFLAGTDLASLRWSDTIATLVAANPGLPVTVWCNEDTPLIWPEIVRAVAGQASGLNFNGTYDLVAEIISVEGMKRLRAYLASHPPETEAQRRRVVAAFLDKFGLQDKIEIELDLPGWTSELVEDLTARYEADLARIEQMPGVTFLGP